MRSVLPVSLALVGIAFLAGAAGPVPGGDVGVIPKGRYICELPGDAGDPGIAAGRHVPGQDFEVIGDSSYRVDQVSGTYLLTGDRLVLTSGPQQGRRFHRISDNFLRVLSPDGSDGDMRCVRSVQTLGVGPDGEELPRPCRKASSLDRSTGLSPQPSCQPEPLTPQ